MDSRRARRRYFARGIRCSTRAGRCCRTRAPFALHVGETGRGVPSAYGRNRHPKPTDFLGGGDNIRIMDYIVLPHEPETFLSALVFEQC